MTQPVMLFRLDAIHQVEGSFCRFFPDIAAASAAEEILALWGWACDYYAQDIDPYFASCLLEAQQVWPMINTESICEMMISLPKEQAA